jgi:hypothetical protein
MGLSSGHPEEAWNVYGAADSRTDPVIDIENPVAVQERGWTERPCPDRVQLILLVGHR